MGEKGYAPRYPLAGIQTRGTLFCMLCNEVCLLYLSHFNEAVSCSWVEITHRHIHTETHTCMYAHTHAIFKYVISIKQIDVRRDALKFASWEYTGIYLSAGCGLGSYIGGQTRFWYAWQPFYCWFVFYWQKILIWNVCGPTPGIIRRARLNPSYSISLSWLGKLF